MTPSGIEQATFQLEGQCLSHLRHQRKQYWLIGQVLNFSLSFEIVVYKNLY